MRPTSNPLDVSSKAYRALSTMLNQAMPDAQERVDKAASQANCVVREALRAEIRLAFGGTEGGTQVPIRIVDGLPYPFSQATGHIIDPLEWRLVLSEGLLRKTTEGLDFLTDFIRKAHERPEVWQILPGGEQEFVGGTKDVVLLLLDSIEKRQLRERLKAIHEDILGAYIYTNENRPEIHLYWMVLSTISAILGISVEALAIVTLTHELAHAFTHVGKDIDGHRWKTELFHNASLDITEGLAQHYAQVVCCKRITTRFPLTASAYDQLLTLQTGPYLAHKNWEPGRKQRLRNGAIWAFTMSSRRNPRSGDWLDQRRDCCASAACSARMRTTPGIHAPPNTRTTAPTST